MLIVSAWFLAEQCRASWMTSLGRAIRPRRLGRSPSPAKPVLPFATAALGDRGQRSDQRGQAGRRAHNGVLQTNTSNSLPLENLEGLAPVASTPEASTAVAGLENCCLEPGLPYSEDPYPLDPDLCLPGPRRPLSPCHAWVSLS